MHTCGIVYERAVDVQLDLAFFSMFWQFLPIYTGDARAWVDAQHQRPYKWSVSIAIGGKYQYLCLLARTDYAAYLIVDEPPR